MSLVLTHRRQGYYRISGELLETNLAGLLTPYFDRQIQHPRESGIEYVNLAYDRDAATLLTAPNIDYWLQTIDFEAPLECDFAAVLVPNANSFLSFVQEDLAITNLASACAFYDRIHDRIDTCVLNNRFQL